MVLLAMIILERQSSTGVLLYIINEFFQLVANGAQYHPARDYGISLNNYRNVCDK